MKPQNASYLLSIVLIAVALLIPANVCPAAEKTAVRKMKGTYTSGGRAIGITRFDPAGDGLHPTVVLLHGLDGADTNQASYEGVAGRLTKQGYIVFFVCYFDVFASRSEDLAFFQANAKQHLLGPDCAERRRMWRAFQDCLTTVGDAVRYARQQPGVDADRVGILGFSLGGFLAVSTATDKELKVKAVVELFGGLPRELKGQAGALPPTLVVHGDQDRIVPVAAAHGLAQVLKASQRVHELQVYPGVGHVFLGDDGQFALWSATQAEWKVLAFLKRNMN